MPIKLSLFKEGRWTLLAHLNSYLSFLPPPLQPAVITPPFFFTKYGWPRDSYYFYTRQLHIEKGAFLEEKEQKIPFPMLHPFAQLRTLFSFAIGLGFKFLIFVQGENSFDQILGDKKELFLSHLKKHSLYFLEFGEI